MVSPHPSYHTIGIPMVWISNSHIALFLLLYAEDFLKTWPLTSNFEVEVTEIQTGPRCLVDRPMVSIKNS